MTESSRILESLNKWSQFVIVYWFLWIIHCCRSFFRIASFTKQVFPKRFPSVSIVSIVSLSWYVI